LGVEFRLPYLPDAIEESYSSHFNPDQAR